MHYLLSLGITTNDFSSLPISPLWTQQKVVLKRYSIQLYSSQDRVEKMTGQKISLKKEDEKKKTAYIF